MYHLHIYTEDCLDNCLHIRCLNYIQGGTDRGALYYTGIDLGECGSLTIKVCTVRMALQEIQDPFIGGL